MRVLVDQEACISSGQCVMAAADVFDQRDDDGLVILLEENPAEHLHNDVREAVMACPVLALRIDEE
ncbi:MAG: ferredoxin [Actinophytocola sp.]|uniref:ferredoxin n=1 Tax=Actinophytocola sp. TaxID=1872138 RepID=UPI003C772131